MKTRTNRWIRFALLMAVLSLAGFAHADALKLAQGGGADEADDPSMRNPVDKQAMPPIGAPKNPAAKKSDDDPMARNPSGLGPDLKGKKGNPDDMPDDPEVRNPVDQTPGH